MKIELIYDGHCPNVDQTRQNLKYALETCGHPPQWTEWVQGNPENPGYANKYGSPTILIEGKDVANSEGINPDCCRIYNTDGQIQGVPPVEMIIKTIQNHEKKLSSWLHGIATLPALGFSLLPVGLCPACLPVYGGFISALGVGFLLNVKYLFPVLLLFYTGAIGSLFYKANERNGIGPGLIGVASTFLVFIGRFWIGSKSFIYMGMTLLIFASLWNLWPARKICRFETGKHFQENEKR